MLKTERKISLVCALTQTHVYFIAFKRNVKLWGRDRFEMGLVKSRAFISKLCGHMGVISARMSANPDITKVVITT